MQPLQQSIWLFPSQFTASDFHTTLSKKFNTRSTAVRTFTRSWFDTFDWRLFRKKQLLIRENDEWILRDFHGKILHTASTSEKHPSPDRFPDSGLRDSLAHAVGIRTLIEYGPEEISASEIRILNSDQKVVAVVHLEESCLSTQDDTMLAVFLHEIRGYEKRYMAVADYIHTLGGEKQEGPEASLKLALRNFGRIPLDYHSGYNVPLDPMMTGGDAVSLIYRSLLNDMYWNKQGVIDDIDTEFLHDLRVAVRRTRSGLSLIKDVLKQDYSEHFKQKFRLIGQTTGPVRDLDVYLLSEDTYRARLPKRLQEGLDHFFRDLADKRVAEQVKLVRFLKSSRYDRILQKWEQLFSENNEHSDGKNSTVPVILLANKIIRKRFQRVLRDGEKIHAGTEDDKLHRLRIQCKKLRYGLEFFSSLYNRKQMKQLIGQLKKLQNNLGDFNDLSVQQEMLAAYLTSLRSGSRKSRETAASIGGLMTDLAREHREVRSRFAETFAGFSKKSNLELYHKLFSKSQEKAWPS